MKQTQTASQTVGPFFRIGLIGADAQNVLTRRETIGQRIRIEGRVLDGDGQPVPDAMLEIWQADANGIYDHPADPLHAEADPSFHGFGRAENRDGGAYFFDTIKPGGRDGHAPYINLLLFARGMLIQAMTRIYFSDEAGNDVDPTLLAVPAARRPTLIAQRQGSSWIYRHDIHLQGEQETVFFEP